MHNCLDNEWVKDLYTVVWKIIIPVTVEVYPVISSSASFGDYTDPGYGYGGITILSTILPLLRERTVPEPSTWAMMLLGFAGLGWVGYWRTPHSRLDRLTALRGPGQGLYSDVILRLS